MELKTYQVTFDPENFESGIDMIAITENPAIEEFALRFKKDEKAIRFSTNEEKRLLVGPAMIPNKKIYRKEGDHEFYVVFSQETIDQMLEKFKSEQRAVQFNLNHDENKIVHAFVKEAWIIEDSEKDKSALYGFNLPVGTLMISAKIQDEGQWNSVIKAMDNVGFSVEGLMGLKSFKEFTKQNNKKVMKKNTKRVFATKTTSKTTRKFNKTLKKFEEHVEITEEKEVLIVEDLKEGSEVEIITDAGVLADAPDGDYAIEDENVVIVVENGVITEVAEAVEDAPAADEEFAEEDEKEAKEEEAKEEVKEEEKEEMEEEVAEDAPAEDSIEAKLDEVIAKLVEIESRIDALEAKDSKEGEEEEGFNKFSKVSKTEALMTIRKAMYN